MTTMTIEEALNFLYKEPTFKYCLENSRGFKYFTNGDGKLFNSKNDLCGVYPEFDFDEYNEPKITILWDGEEIDVYKINETEQSNERARPKENNH